MRNQISSSWSKQQDQLIRLIANKNKVKDWSQVVYELKKQFSTNLRTAAQCRDRYLQLIDKQKQYKKQNEWSSQQLKTLIELFLKHGLKWTYISQFFPHRTENCVKNKFYNNLRKAARKLADIQHNRLRAYSKSSLTCEMITIILQLCHQLVTVCQSKNIKISMNSIIFEVRKKILDISFANQFALDQVQAYDLIKDIRKLNSSLRCFGVYKTKKRKNWNLNTKKLESIIKLINLTTSSPAIQQIQNEQQIQYSIPKCSKNQNKQEIVNQIIKVQCSDQNENEIVEQIPQKATPDWHNWINYLWIQNQIYWSNLQNYFNCYYYSQPSHEKQSGLGNEKEVKQTKQQYSEKEVKIKEQNKNYHHYKNYLNMSSHQQKNESRDINQNIKYDKNTKTIANQFQQHYNKNKQKITNKYF